MGMKENFLKAVYDMFAVGRDPFACEMDQPDKESGKVPPTENTKDRQNNGIICGQ